MITQNHEKNEYFTHNTWEPWKEVRDVEILHTYLRANNLLNIIPKKFST
jgi:hypothetical protein